MTGSKKPAREADTFSDNRYIQWFGREFFGVFTPQAECLKISSNWLKVSGWSVKACLGSKFLEHIRKIDRPKFQKFLRNPYEERKLRLRMRHKEGHWDWLEISSANRLEDGNIGIIFHKITEEVGKENALQKANLETELAMRGQSEFFAHISHELRTPLNAILGFAQMMHQGMFGEIANPRYRDYIQVLEQSGQELLAKIDDLLEISSLCAGIDQLSEKNVPLPEVVRTAVNIHARELFSRHIQINVDVEKALIVADKTKLQQALSHLIRNAVKFSPDGGTISIGSERSENGNLSIVIADQGNGFSGEQVEYFDRAARNLTFLERNRKLMGFGLPLAEELIRLHGGRLRCRNTDHSGAEVTITLPAKRIIGVITDKHPSRSGRTSASGTSTESLSF